MVVQLSDILLSWTVNDQRATHWKALALRGLADQETAASVVTIPLVMQRNMNR
jgi:hypothetical protein